MNTVILGVAPLAAAAAVFGSFPIVTRIAARHRKLTSLICVVDMRTYREAAARIPKLVAADELSCAHAGLHSMNVWLTQEAKNGRPSRRDWCNREIANWTLYRAEVIEKMGFDGMVVL